ncbi:MAG: hypothetical protein CMJ49_02150, partial [Planctomycetaceae bacterium]|nr:hypothetical protein [Planctomycetaceae bacterium]
SGGTITQIAREGGAVPDGNGVFASMNSHAALNNLHHVAFLETLTGTSGGTSDYEGVFIGDGVEVVRVVRRGQALAGSTVMDVHFTPGTGADEGEERTGLNDFGQVAYWASLANGNSLIGLWTPDLHWRTAGSGFWTTDSNWTLGIEPDALYDTFIDPVGSVNVTGHSINETVKSLTVGSTGDGLATLKLTSNGDLHALGDITINADGRIEVSSLRVLSSDADLTNAGTLDTDGTVGTVDATTLTNTGVLTGDGTVAATLDNQLGGEVLVSAGDSLHIVNNGTHNNAGRINVIDADILFNGITYNAVSTGLIAARDAILQFNGGLTNNGAMGLSFGTTDVFGDVDNTATGQIAVSGNSNATFWDDVINDGNITTSTGSTSVFFGAVSGTGNFPGGGTIFFEGDLAPGSSPATVSFGGNVVLGPFSKTLIELGGTAPGTLNVVYIDAGGGVLVPQAGHVFDLFDFNTFTSDFATINLPSLASTDPDLRWHLNKLKTTGELLTTFIADLNGDFTVDIADLGLVGGQWGTDGTGFPSGFNADINGDGVVDVADLGQMGGQWGLTANTSLGSGSTVPVPGAGLMGIALIGAVGLARRRRVG